MAIQKLIIRIIANLIVLLLMPGIFGCTGVQPAAGEPISNRLTYTDPYAYCVAVVQIDKPDERFSGSGMNDAFFRDYLKSAGLDVTLDYPESFKMMTVWRCMVGKVYACNYGANIPCDSKADANQMPTEAMQEFCRHAPESEFIPMSVTGHATIYSWHCTNGSPGVLKQIQAVDKVGFPAGFWIQVEPYG